MEVLSITNKAGGAREIRRSRVEAGGDHLISRRWVTHPSNNMEGGAIISIFLITRWVTHPSNNMEGGAIISIFLITRTIGVSGGTPALWLTAGFPKV